MSQIYINGIIFHSIMDNITSTETKVQELLWGKMYIDYLVESKSKDRKRFFISEKLYGIIPKTGA